MSCAYIVVGLDDSQAARAALRWAAEQARVTGGRLRAVNVVEPPLITDGMGSSVASVLSISPSDVSPMVRNTMAQLFQDIDPDERWTLEFGLGRVGKVLCELSLQAALLVVGRGEHVGLGRLMIGSTSHFCLSHAECPVVAVPAGSALERLQRAEARAEALDS